MGYTPDSHDAIITVLQTIDQQCRTRNHPTGWTAIAEVVRELADTGTVHRSTWKSRIAKAHAIGLLVRMTTIPAILDQRCVYIQLSDMGRQAIDQTDAVGPTVALRQTPGQTLTAAPPAPAQEG